MARIRIVDEWLRSPASTPVRARAVMVVADTWAEQKVLMRGFQSCQDQSRPAIVLHGSALAMGPAGVDPHGAWGIHVDDTRDGRAQELKEQLELAARRLHGGKGNPPRLVDEESSFERKATNQWTPGSPRDRRSQVPLRNTPTEPMAAGSEPDATRNISAGVPRPEVKQVVRRASVIPTMPGESMPMAPAQRAPAPPQAFSAHPDARTIMPFGDAPSIGQPPPAAVGQPPPPTYPVRRTPKGWTAPPRSRRASNPPPQQKFRRINTPVPTSDGLGRIVGRTMPIGFNLSEPERKVLNQLGKVGRMSAREVGRVADAPDGVAWMEALMIKLANHGLDIIEPADDIDGDPTYTLRR